MRALPLAALLLLTMPLLAAPAAAKEAPTASLVVDVRANGAEEMRLVFRGLDANTEYRGICLPARATLVRVHDAQGDLPHDARRDDGRTSITFRPRESSVTIDMTRPPSGDGAPPLHTASVNFCTMAGSAVDITVRAAPPLDLFFASAPGRADGREARWTAHGPIFVTYAYEAPLDDAARLVAVDVEPLRVFAPRARAAEAEEIARVAAPAFVRAAREAGLVLPWSPLRVHFAAPGEFAWEAGHYGGDGIIAVKPTTLENDPREGFPYVGAKVVVHEAFHAISAPYGKGEVNDTLAWWLEGTARHAERQVDVELPGGAKHCETQGAQIQCWFFDDRITEAELEAAYAPGFTFDPRWEPSLPQTDETRRFHYAYSEFLAASYKARAGLAAYRAAWSDVASAFVDPARCPCDAGWLEGVLLDHARNLTRAELYRPWADLRAADPPAFDARVAALVAEEPRVDAPPLFGLPIPGAGLAAAVACAAVALLRRRA